MVKTEEKQKEDKVETIITAAQKRFGLYGVEKTSMQEIANDLRMSKASLYYYFPDKESLYKSVISREHTEFLRKLDEDIKNIPDPAECLKKYSLARISYLKKLMSLSRLRLSSYDELKPVIADLLKSYREEEKKAVIQILEKGISDKLFKIDDTYKTSTLLLDILRGQSRLIISCKDPMVFSDAEYNMLYDKVKDIVEIFIKGLMYR
jgi:AcrR family transcriptional regulator